MPRSTHSTGCELQQEEAALQRMDAVPRRVEELRQSQHLFDLTPEEKLAGFCHMF